jgi:hypothetical protein
MTCPARDDEEREWKDGYVLLRPASRPNEPCLYWSGPPVGWTEDVLLAMVWDDRTHAQGAAETVGNCQVAVMPDWCLD